MERFPDDMDPAAMCDVDEERPNFHADRYNADKYTSYCELLRSCDCDIVSLCTPCGLHSSQTTWPQDAYGDMTTAAGSSLETAAQIL